MVQLLALGRLRLVQRHLRGRPGGQLPLDYVRVQGLEDIVQRAHARGMQASRLGPPPTAEGSQLVLTEGAAEIGDLGEGLAAG